MPRRTDLLRALPLALLLLALPAAAQDLVSFAKEVRRAAPVAGSLVSVGGDVLLDAPVSRDVIVLGGNVTLGTGAEVSGDVLVVGGRVRSLGGDPRLAVKGEIHSLEALEAAFLSELETSPAGRPGAGLLLSLRVALLVVWLAIGSLLLFLAPRRVQAAAATVPAAALLDALLGGLALLSGALLTAFLLATLPTVVALAGAAALLALLLAAKAFGLAVLFVALGRRIAAGAARGTPLWGDPAALALGLLALGALSLVPVAGRVLWMAASIVAIGNALGTRFGRPLGHLTLSARRA